MTLICWKWRYRTLVRARCGLLSGAAIDGWEVSKQNSRSGARQQDVGRADRRRANRTVPSRSAAPQCRGRRVHRAVKVKVGPISVQYKGKAVFQEKDESAHRAVITASGRETPGAGQRRRDVTAELKDEGDATSCVLTTDLTISGKAAQRRPPVTNPRTPHPRRRFANPMTQHPSICSRYWRCRWPSERHRRGRAGGRRRDRLAARAAEGPGASPRSIASGGSIRRAAQPVASWLLNARRKC